MNRLGTNCIDCGCKAVSTITDEIKPVYKMSTTRYSCGAVMISTTGAHGQLAKISHEGCSTIQHSEAV